MKSSSYHFPKKTVRDVPLHDKRVLLRADFNVPIDEKGNISSDYRIVMTLPTIKYLLQRGCEVIIISHLGRPDGKKDFKYTLQPVADRLQELLGQKVDFLPGGLDDSSRQSLRRPRPGTVSLLENIRFYPGEEENDPDFVGQIMEVIKPAYFVQDCFGVSHRAHASIKGICSYVPAVAGLLLEKEVTTLEAAVHSPARPLVAVLGGAKISDKLPLVERFLEKADTILIGGAMANTFLKASGAKVGKSLIDEDGLKDAEAVMKKAKPGQIILPSDVAVADEISVDADRHDMKPNEMGDTQAILDIGFETMRQFAGEIETATTVIWNGPMGFAENPHFTRGSDALAEALSRHPDITSIIGGGDTADFILDWLESHKDAHFTHISTGGGASLELMSGQKLPGVEALLDA